MHLGCYSLANFIENARYDFCVYISAMFTQIARMWIKAALRVCCYTLHFLGMRLLCYECLVSCV